MPPSTSKVKSKACLDQWAVSGHGGLPIRDRSPPWPANLKTNLYVSVVANSLAEMPAYLLTALLLDRFGRKPLAIGTMLLAGVFCTAGSLIAGAGIMR